MRVVCCALQKRQMKTLSVHAWNAPAGKINYL